MEKSGVQGYGKRCCAAATRGRGFSAASVNRPRRGPDCRSDEPAGQAVSEALLALCHAALGDIAASNRVAARARELRSRTNQRGEVLLLDIALTELQGNTGARQAAVARTACEALAASARRRGFGWVLQRMTGIRWASMPAAVAGHEPVRTRLTWHAGMSRDAYAACAARQAIAGMDARAAIWWRSISRHAAPADRHAAIVDRRPHRRNTPPNRGGRSRSVQAPGMPCHRLARGY